MNPGLPRRHFLTAVAAGTAATAAKATAVKATAVKATADDPAPANPVREVRLERFIAAEAAVVNRQVGRASENRQSWAAWRHIGEGVFNDYGRLLADEQFESIAKLTSEL